MKFMFTSLLASLIICNFLAFTIVNSAVTYQVDHFGYKEETREVVTWGGNQDEGSVFATTDNNGLLYVTCYSKSFGIVGEDVWVIKYATNMSVLWNVTWQTNDFARPAGILVDANGYVYVGGTIVTEFEPANYIHDAFLVKFSHNGTRLWNYTRHDPNQEDDVTSISIDYSGSVYLIGACNSTQGELFIQKYSLSGIYQDTFYYGNTAPREQIIPGGTAIDTKGNIYIAASTDNCPAGNIMDAVLIKLNSTGHHLWNTTFGDTSPADRGFDVVFSYYNIFVVGTLGTTDAAIVKFNSSGDIFWSDTWNLQTDQGIAITINKHWNPVIAGNTDYYGATEDIIMAEYLPNGTRLWNASYQGPQIDQTSDIRADGDKLYTLGRSYDVANGYQVIIIVYEDNTVTQFPSIGPYGKIFGGIIGGLITAFALLFIAGILITYWKKA
jgi:hypothetical protein